MKSAEQFEEHKDTIINKKHKMYWNCNTSCVPVRFISINKKHKMYWNRYRRNFLLAGDKINKKHKMYWNRSYWFVWILVFKLTKNIRCIEMYTGRKEFVSVHFINKEHKMYWNLYTQEDLKKICPINKEHKMYWN